MTAKAVVSAPAVSTSVQPAEGARLKMVSCTVGPAPARRPMYRVAVTPQTMAVSRKNASSRRAPAVRK